MAGLILTCGLPASGKTTLARRLSRSLGIPMFSKDSMKELLFDTVGFRSRKEKAALGEGAMAILYYAAGQVLKAGGWVILENNFEQASEPGLKQLLSQHLCRYITLQLVGDQRAIYERFIARDNSPHRHRGHVVNTVYPEPPGKPPEYIPMGFDRFVEGFTARGMEQFDIGGPRLPVDVTDFAKVDYGAAERVLRAFMEKDERKSG